MVASIRRPLEVLLAKHQPLIRDAFLEAIAEIRSGVTLRLLVERLERGDIQGALDALQIEREAFGRVEMALQEAFNAGGTRQADGLRLRDPLGGRLVFRFGVRNPMAEAWLAEHGAALVTQIVDDQRVAVQSHLIDGMVAGQNPRQTALKLIGRTNRATNQRVGGIIGLTAAQARYVDAARAELLSGDPAALRHYLERQRRDRRFDATVRKAIAEGRALPRDMVDRITGRYADRMLSLRGEMLARTEAMSALNGGRVEAMRQAIAAGKVDARFVTKRWRATHDGRTRTTHALLHGQTASFAEPFVSATGARLMFPGDPAAPVQEHIGCRCTMEIEVDYIAQLVERRRAA